MLNAQYNIRMSLEMQYPSKHLLWRLERREPMIMLRTKSPRVVHACIEHPLLPFGQAA
jgi:hypothetical protein